MKKLAFILLSILAAFGIYVGGTLALAEFRAYQATKAAASYLFTPQTEVKDKDGKTLTRAQILDAIMADIIARQQAQPPAAGK